MRTCVFLDLDDTILQTRRKCPPGEPVEPAGFGRDGAPLSFLTARQSALLGLLARGADVIPTTARDLDAFRRVRLPLPPPPLAILDFGAVILRPDGTPEPGWDAAIRPRAEAQADGLRRARRDVQDFIAARGLGVRARLVADFDMPLYLVLKHPGGDLAALESVRREHWAAVDETLYAVHGNGNNLALVPRFLGKELAVRHVLDHLLGPGPVLSVGVGDGLSDAPFLALCDYAVLPRGCQLAREGFRTGGRP